RLGVLVNFAVLRQEPYLATRRDCDQSAIGRTVLGSVLQDHVAFGIELDPLNPGFFERFLVDPRHGLVRASLDYTVFDQHLTLKEDHPLALVNPSGHFIGVQRYRLGIAGHTVREAKNLVRRKGGAAKQAEPHREQAAYQSLSPALACHAASR